MTVPLRGLAVALAMAGALLAQAELPTRVDILIPGGTLVYIRRPVYPKLARQMRLSATSRFGATGGPLQSPRL